MFFTHREYQILEQLIASQEGVQLSALETSLKVSRRTIYRELASIEATIVSLGMQLVKPRGKGYRLVGTPEQFDQLRQQMQTDTSPQLDVQERQHGLISQLLLTQSPITTQSFAESLEVSLNTIQGDLQAIQEVLVGYPVSLVGNGTSGYLLKGSELTKRLLVSQLIDRHTSELDFYHYLTQLKQETVDQLPPYFMQLIDREALIIAERAFFQGQEQFEDTHRVTDNQLKHFLIAMAISIQRITQGYIIDEPITARKISKQSLQRAHLMSQIISEQIHVTLDLHERHQLASQLDGINYKQEQTIFYEQFDTELTYRVKELIRLTALYSGNDFRLDEELYYNLFQHIEAALHRAETPIEVDNNQALDRVIQEYDWLYQALMAAFQEVFDETALAMDELVYILIHFATSYEREPHHRHQVNALVITTSDVGTARILERRLHKYLPELKFVQFVPLSQLVNVRFEDYDLILSTIHLPHFAYDYHWISPVLDQQDIQRVRELWQQIDQRDPVSDTETIDYVKQLIAVEDYLRTGRQLLSLFDLTNIQARSTIEETTHMIIAQLPQDIVDDPQLVAERVINRYLMAPIGIPNTHLAIFHTSNPAVKQAMFRVYDLDRSFWIPGMNGDAIQLRRMLLILAPDPMSEQEQRLLSVISSSVIESDLNTSSYDSGDKMTLYQLLNELFIHELKRVL